ncbi:hypothetical protein D3C83_30340 [compost metagenome]
MQPAARLYHAIQLGEKCALVRREIDHAVRNHDIDAVRINRQPVYVALFKAHMTEAGFRCAGARAFEHFVGHVHTDDLAAGPDAPACQQSIHSRAGADVQHTRVPPQRLHKKRITDAGKRRRGAARQ